MRIKFNYGIIYRDYNKGANVNTETDNFVQYMYLGKRYWWGGDMHLELYMRGRAFKVVNHEPGWKLYAGEVAFSFDTFEDLMVFIFETEEALRKRFPRRSR